RRSGVEGTCEEAAGAGPSEVGPGSRHPATAPEGLQGGGRVAGCRLGRAWMPPHLDRLLEAFGLLVPGRLEKVDLSDPVQFAAQPCELLVTTGRRSPFAGPLKTAQDFPVTLGHRPVVLISCVLEQTHDLRRFHVLDLIDRQQRGLAPILLHLLGEPLELLLVLRGEGQEIDRALERDRSDRPQPPPRLHTEARRMYWKAEN